MSGIEIMEDFWHNYAQGDGFLYFSTIKDSTLSRIQIVINAVPSIIRLNYSNTATL